MEDKSLSIFLPAFNEEENIQEVVLNIIKFLKKRFADFEIIVVNDGSTDKTSQIVAELSKKDNRIKLVSHPQNQGYGATLRTGFKEASGDLIFYTDADAQFDIQDLDLILPLIKKFDVVSAYRINRQDPLMRIFIAKTYNLLIRLLFGLKIKDIDCAFKLFKKGALKNINLKANTGLIEAELLLKLQKKGVKIGQIGVKHLPRTKGQTVYEAGSRNKVFAFVKPQVVLDILKEIKSLWGELH